jgi:hypothetical protein
MPLTDGCVYFSELLIDVKRRGSSCVRQAVFCFLRYVLRQFLGEQLQQPVVSNLIARRVTFADGYQLTVPRDILVMHVRMHCASSAKGSVLLSSPASHSEAKASFNRRGAEMRDSAAVSKRVGPMFKLDQLLLVRTLP